MREIKFRAFCTLGNYMLSFVDLTETPWEGHPVLINALTGQADHLKLMQYTGLKDKNGVDIYEGDIVEHFAGIRTVQWNQDYGAWSMGMYQSITDQECGPYDCYEIEVIGNIYENPELLG